MGEWGDGVTNYHTGPHPIISYYITFTLYITL